MKKLLLVLLLAITPLTAAAGWQHRLFFDGRFYLVHPDGSHWYLTCTSKASRTRCRFSKSRPSDR